MATITSTKEPQFVDLAYGKNILSLFDTDEDGLSTKYFARILEPIPTGFNIKFDIRQTPNPVGYGHFDFGRLLQTQVQGNPAIETIPKLTTAENEVFPYKVQIGYINSAGNIVFTTPNGILPLGSGIFSEFTVLPGRKPYNQIDWDYSDYVPDITFSTFGGIDIISDLTKVKALTDRHIDTVTGAQITDAKPSALGDTEIVHKIKLGIDDDYTLSFLNRWTTDDDTYGAFCNGINRFSFYVYDGSENVTHQENIIGNGGGPDVAASDNLVPTGSYTVISAQTGKNNPAISSYPNRTHYYVLVQTFTSDEFTSHREWSEWYRFDIDNGECNDFDHIQVSWLNSFGFRDYFTFEKRNDHNISVERTTFTKLDADWAGTTIEVPSYASGETIFGQSATEEYTANTRYLDDVESTYLKNLYLSPDVRVRFAGQDNWVPVVLTSNQWTQRTFRKDKLFQHTITFKPANPINMQQG